MLNQLICSYLSPKSTNVFEMDAIGSDIFAALITTYVAQLILTTNVETIYDSTFATKMASSASFLRAFDASFVGVLLPFTILGFTLLILPIPPQSSILVAELSSCMQNMKHNQHKDAKMKAPTRK